MSHRHDGLKKLSEKLFEGGLRNTPDSKNNDSNIMLSVKLKSIEHSRLFWFKTAANLFLIQSMSRTDVTQMITCSGDLQLD